MVRRWRLHETARSTRYGVIKLRIYKLTPPIANETSGPGAGLSKRSSELNTIFSY